TSCGRAALISAAAATVISWAVASIPVNRRSSASNLLIGNFPRFFASAPEGASKASVIIGSDGTLRLRSRQVLEPCPFPSCSNIVHGWPETGQAPSLHDIFHHSILFRWRDGRIAQPGRDARLSTYTSFVFDKGNSRTRLPVAANTALYRAGAKGGTPGSPTPAGGASLFTICTSTCRGARFMRAS